MLELMEKQEIQSEISKLDKELTTVINILMVIVGFFMLEVILLSFGIIAFNFLSVLGIMGATVAFYTKLKSAKLKARILVMLESLNK
jgi:small-conductance mechanosensitive channel